MKEIKRRDIILIVLMTLSCILLAVSRPDNTDVRTVVWDFTTFLMMGATAIWFITEMFSWLGDAVNGAPSVSIPTGMSKNGLVVLAHKEGIADKETLEKLSEEDLIALIKTNGKSKTSTTKPTIFVVVSGVWSLIKEIARAIIAKYRWIVQKVKGVFNRKKVKKSVRRSDVRKRK